MLRQSKKPFQVSEVAIKRGLELLECVTGVRRQTQPQIQTAARLSAQLSLRTRLSTYCVTAAVNSDKMAQLIYSIDPCTIT